MIASRIIATPVLALARTPKIPLAFIPARHVFTKPSNDDNTLAKSADMLNALLGSTLGLAPKHSTPPSPLRATQLTQPVVVTNESTATEMFIPPAHDPLLDYIAAVIQRDGLRARAARTVSRMLLHIHTFTRAPPMPIVREAVMTAAPAVRIVSFKYGTKVMMTPQPLTEKQRVRAGLKQIISASESKPGKSLEVRLAREMISVVRGESRALDEKERLHKLAMVNRGNIRR